MILFLAGPIYGQFEEFYEKVRLLEKDLNVKTDYILQTGNIGIYPDPNRIDRNMRNNLGVGDFPHWYLKQTTVPRPTFFIAGKSEDHRWMESLLSQARTEILPGLVWLLNGYYVTIGYGEETCNIVSLGKVYSPNTFNRGRGTDKKKLAHYTRGEVEKACSTGPMDILLTHEPPTTPGVDSIIFATRPKLIVHQERIRQQKKSVSVHTVSLSTMDIVPIKWENREFCFF